MIYWKFVVIADFGDGEILTEDYPSLDMAQHVATAVLTLSGPAEVSVRIERRRD